MQSFEAKVVVLGKQGVGKSSVVTRYLEGSFPKLINPTIGASFFTCRSVLDDYRIKLQIWDTAGQERFRSMAPLYYRNANAAFIVYDITCPESFEDVKNWVKELRRNVERKIALCIIGNKADLKDKRLVEETTAENYAASINAAYFETSAMSGAGVSDAFCNLTRQLISLFEVSQSQFLVVEDYYKNQSPVKDEIRVDGVRYSSPPAAAANPADTNKNCCRSG